ncbi:Palmitoyltransferase PFA4 [Escovopsis weberi]|uniref:Palmitoyltransferase PFA4 n=1 Tax=Escovopsis weberi TaxID=150374 RepID=A0A0M8NAG6_ESCWE|nr:Palmitoyltransferase PFA4 [Escovopsis weberi]
MAGLGNAPFIQRLAVPAVCLLIAFLSYFSQAVFRFASLEPGPPTRNESAAFNASVLCIWLTYFRAATVDPGAYVFREQVIEADGRWCRKCRAPKPPRAHHCRTCGRCIPKMDHHCPWTGNCVSMTTFPHFVRFLVFANVSLWMLGRLLWLRFYAIYEARDLPSYLGPSLPALASLSLVALVWALTTLALGIILTTTLQAWACNRTTIEGWEMERHEAVLGRGGRDWWDITGPDGEKMRFERVEFPYDVGFFANMAQAMGTPNFLLWLWPLAGHPSISKDGVSTGWAWQENGFNRKEGMWPPPDPDRYRQAAGAERPFARRNFEMELQAMDVLGPEELKAAFRERQEQDLRRRKLMLIEELEEVDDYTTDDDDDEYDYNYEYDEDDSKKKRRKKRPRGAPGGWTNTDGETLRDYGVDEDTEDGDENVPIAELMRRRKTAAVRGGLKMD